MTKLNQYNTLADDFRALEGHLSSSELREVHTLMAGAYATVNDSDNVSAPAFAAAQAKLDELKVKYGVNVAPTAQPVTPATAPVSQTPPAQPAPAPVATQAQAPAPTPTSPATPPVVTPPQGGTTDDNQAPAWAQSLLMMQDDNGETTTVRAVVEQTRERVWDLNRWAGDTDTRLDRVEKKVTSIDARKDTNPLVGGVVGFAVLAVVLLLMVLVWNFPFFTALAVAALTGAGVAILVAKVVPPSKNQNTVSDQN